MMNSMSIRPRNSVIFICDPTFLSDPALGTIPVLTKGSAVAATESRISIACASEQDGPTRVTFGRTDEIAAEGAPDLDCQVETPAKTVNLATVGQDAVFSLKVGETLTRVRVWINHPRWPDEVAIGIG